MVRGSIMDRLRIADVGKTWQLACILLLVGVLVACARQSEEPPGEGDKAEQGYAVCNYIIEILEDYKNAQGSYPATLEELVPDYSPAFPVEVNGRPIIYRKIDEGFDLSFSYIGPGMNHCTYSTADGRKWRCSGAY